MFAANVWGSYQAQVPHNIFCCAGCHFLIVVTRYACGVACLRIYPNIVFRSVPFYAASVFCRQLGQLAYFHCFTSLPYLA
jgi:hypothetical protein